MIYLYYLDYILRHDLLMHFFVGFFIFLGAEWVFDTLIAVVLVGLVAIMKELVWDGYLGYGKPELIDVIYTIAPALIIIILR